MAKKDKKKKQTGLALACWILGFLILLIVFLIKQEDIKTNLKTTNFFERLFGSTPEFIANHEIKEEIPENDEPVLKIVEEKPAPKTEEKKVEEVKPVEPVYVPEVKKEEKAPEVKPEVKNETKQPAKTEPVQEKKTEAAKPAAPVVEKKPVSNQKLCFVYIGEDGVVSRKIITREVEKNDSPLVTNINLLIKGPNSSEAAKGYKSLIPSGTRLLSASVRDGIAYLNFSEDFEFNYVGVDGYLGQLMQIVYTATEFSTVKGVQFLIEGQKKAYLGSESVWIGTPLARNSF